jgi:HSP20 family protein
MTTEIARQETTAQDGAVTRVENELPLLVPPVDICETAAEITLTADMPGIELEDVDVTVENNVLVIEARKVARDAGAGRQAARRETRCGCYRRVFELADRVNTSDVKARLKDGVLEVTLKKRDTDQGRRKIAVATAA